MIHAMDCVVMCVRPGSAEKNTGSPSEHIICALKGTLTEGFTFPETVITK